MRILTALFALVLSAGSAFAQANVRPDIDFPNIVIKVTPLNNGIYMLEGAGGNITVAVGKDGFLMVDAQYIALFDKINAAIKTFTDAKVRYLVNTHVHRDHTNGNPSWAKAGAVIVAQTNLRTRLAAGFVNGGDEPIPPMEPAGLPRMTYPDRMSLRLNGQTAELIHPDPAHTDGDTIVYFPDANIISTGDIYTANRYPNIDTDNGGGVDGILAAVDLILSKSDDNTKIVPGHGPLANKAKLTEYRRMMSTIRDRVVALKKQGKTEDQVVAAKPAAEFNAVWAQNPTAGDRAARQMYRSKVLK